jgi:hypothetical protein
MMTNNPRNDPAQQPRDPSTNPDGEQPIKDPAQNPKDPCIKPPENPDERKI